MELLYLLLDESAQIDTLRVQLHRPGEREQALDRLQQQTGFFFCALQSPFRDVVNLPTPCQFHVPEDGRQRAAELMGDAGGDLAELRERGHLLHARLEAADRREVGE